MDSEAAGRWAERLGISTACARALPRQRGHRPSPRHLHLATSVRLRPAQASRDWPARRLFLRTGRLAARARCAPGRGSLDRHHESAALRVAVGARAAFRNMARLGQLLAESGQPVSVVRGPAEYRAARQAGRHAAWLGIQGGTLLEFDLADFDRPELAKLSLVTLLHFTRSRIGAPALPRALARGDQHLTAFGRDYVRKLDAKRDPRRPRPHQPDRFLGRPRSARSKLAPIGQPRAAATRCTRTFVT